MLDEDLKGQDKWRSREMVESFRELKVYQKAYKYSLEIHKKSKSFPQHEQTEIGSQIRRASKSISLNIAEGFGKQSSMAEFKRFLMIARGSCDEVRVELDYCKDLGYISEEEHSYFEQGYIEIGKMLTSMVKKWQYPTAVKS